MTTKNIGFDIKGKTDAKDVKSPFSGKVGIRGRSFVGTVVAAKMQKTATIEWEQRVKVPKYERFLKKKTRVKAHNPDSIKAQEGDIVKIYETRPLSKTKNFVIVEKLGKEKEFLQKQEALESSKAGRTEENGSNQSTSN